MEAPRKPQDASEAVPEAAEPADLQIDPGAAVEPYIEGPATTPNPRPRALAGKTPRTPTKVKPKRAADKPPGIGLKRTSIRQWKVDPKLIAKQLYG